MSKFIKSFYKGLVPFEPELKDPTNQEIITHLEQVVKENKWLLLIMLSLLITIKLL